MANKRKPVPGTRGYRVELVRIERGVEQQAFARELADKAVKLGFFVSLKDRSQWTESRLSGVINGRQLLTLNEAAAVVALDPLKRGWDWLVFGPDVVARQGLPAVADPEAQEEQDVVEQLRASAVGARLRAPKKPRVQVVKARKGRG